MNETVSAFQLAVVAIFALLALYLAMLAFGRVQRYRLTEKLAAAELAGFRAELDLVLERKKQQVRENELSWNGYRKFEVWRKEMEGADICSFYLRPHDRRDLPPFKPGQYLTFQLDIPGQKKPVIRCYSLSDSPMHPDYYRLTIKRIPPPRDTPEVPPGLSSSYFHDTLNENDIIDVKAPSGHFFLDTERHHPVVLIGGGIGLTPVLSMLNTIAESGSRQEAWFFYGVRNESEHVMKDHLARLDRENDNVRLQVCYSDPTDESREGNDYHHAERVSVELFRRVLPSNNYDFYLCGPPPMMNAIVAGLEAWGVPEERIHFEAFGPASVKKVKEAHDGGVTPDTAFEITFARSGKKVTWNADYLSILECAEENDVNIDFGCRAGNCGTCKTAVKEGDVALLQDVGADCEKGSCLTCVSAPRSNLVLDA